MLFWLYLLGGCWVVQSEDYRKLYKDTVIHYKDPDFEVGKTQRLSSTASNLLRDSVHYRAFKKNAEEVIKHNKEPNTEWVAEINQFALETDEEFSHHLGLNMSMEAEREIKMFRREKREAIDRAVIEELEAKEVDYTPYLPPVKDQGNCGSCYAFGAVAAAEYQVNKKRPVGGEMVALSEEQCINCAAKNGGCYGGQPYKCYTWAYLHFSHWASSYNYVYEGRDFLKCKYDVYQNGMSGFKFYKPGAQLIGNSDEDVLYAVANNQIGVLVTAMPMKQGDGTRFYRSGVFSTETCNSYRANHAVNIVGYGKLNGIPYWRVRNSWGAWWGDGGYINIKRGVNGNNLNMCHITEYAYYPYIEGSDDGKGSGTESEAMRLECGDGYQVEYRGNINKTVSGRDCQRWDSKDPHNPHPSHIPENNQYNGLEKNYCRNPNSRYQWRKEDRGAFCYTTDPSKLWELCPVPDCSRVKWCELTDYEYLDRLAGRQEYDDLDSAKSICYSNVNCAGISKSSSGTYLLMAGPLSPTSGAVVTYSKGLCKQLPPVGEYCKMENVKLTKPLIAAPTLLEAKQMCTSVESCVGVSGGIGGYRLYSNKKYSTSHMDSWYKGYCPCGLGIQSDYRGKINVTESGRTCQRWDSQTPHLHHGTPENYPDSGLEDNYCRNPDAPDRIPCRYTRTNYFGGDMANGKVIVETEQQCVDHCLMFTNCIAVTFVGPNPDEYGSNLQGCYKKSGGWSVKTGTAFQANMVSVDVSCIRNRRGHVIDAQKNVEYELNKQLEVGDVIRAWGVYKDHSTSKFSVNIRGSSSLYLIHVDFRPFNDVVLLNNYDNGWKTDVRPAFSRNNFAADTLFEVRIEIHQNEYRIFFNGNELVKRFPHRVDLNTANHVVLHGGSNGFKWTALHLPNGQLAGSGISFATRAGKKNYLELPLAVGNVITAWGIYATGSSKFSVNLMTENGQYFMIYVDFRPPPYENKVVLNSKKQNGWGTELKTALPTFENGKVFKVDVKCLDGEFEIYHDGNVLGSKFPYRDGFALEDVKFVWLLGGSSGMVWTDLAMPNFGSGWTAVERNVFIEFDMESTPLEIRTDSEMGSDDRIILTMYTAEGGLAGGVYIYFLSTPQYMIGACTEATDFPTNVNLPSTKDKVWRITVTRTEDLNRVVIHCNNVKVLNFQPSDTTCSKKTYWASRWTQNIAKIQFYHAVSFSATDTASDYYRSYKGGSGAWCYTTDKNKEWEFCSVPMCD